jgi:hypothetical protein
MVGFGWHWPFPSAATVAAAAVQVANLTAVLLPPSFHKHQLRLDIAVLKRLFSHPVVP